MSTTTGRLGIETTNLEWTDILILVLYFVIVMAVGLIVSLLYLLFLFIGSFIILSKKYVEYIFFSWRSEYNLAGWLVGWLVG